MAIDTIWQDDSRETWTQLIEWVNNSPIKTQPTLEVAQAKPSRQIKVELFNLKNTSKATAT